MNSKILRDLCESYQNIYDDGFESWVNSLIEEGYDLSDYTWEEMYEAYLDEASVRGGRVAGSNTNVYRPATTSSGPAGGGMYGRRGTGRNRSATQTSSSPGALRVSPSAKPPAPAPKPESPAAKPPAPAPAPAARPPAPAPATKPAAPAPVASTPKPTAKVTPTPAAPKKTFNPLMQRTFGYPTGYAPDQIKNNPKKMAQMGSTRNISSSFEWGSSSKIVDEVANAYSSIYEAKKKDQDQDGDNDFADVRIARMIASGMSKAEAIAAVKNKEYNEEFESWVDSLVEEGYDLSNYTMDEMFDIYLDEAEGSYGATPKAYSAARKTKMTAKRKPFLKKMLSRTNPANRTSPYDSPRKGLTADDRERARAGSKHGVGTRQDHDYPSEGPGGITKSTKKLRKQKAMGEFGEAYEIDEATRMRKELGKEGETATRKELAARSKAYKRSGSVDKTIAAAERGADRPYIKHKRDESDADRKKREERQSRTLRGLASSRRGSVRDKPRVQLRGYAAKVEGSDKDLQRARSSAMSAGTLTPREKEKLGEDFEIWIDTLLQEGYDLSDYTWDEMYEIYEETAEERDARIAARRARVREMEAQGKVMTSSRRTSERAKQRRQEKKDEALEKAANRALADTIGTTRRSDKPMGSEAPASKEAAPAANRRLGRTVKRDTLASRADELLKMLQNEDFELWLEDLIEEGYNLEGWTDGEIIDLYEEIIEEKYGTVSGRKKVAKMARSGKDIGKKGPGFQKMVDKLTPKYGKERATKIAAAQMYKTHA